MMDEFNLALAGAAKRHRRHLLHHAHGRSRGNDIFTRMRSRTQKGNALRSCADRRRPVEGAQRADAADAEHHLLADAHVVIAAVEPAVIWRSSALFCGMLVSSK